MLRTLFIFAALALPLVQPSQAALFVAPPASLPPTPENASTAFLEGGSESRIGLLCHNDPVNKSDPFGLDTFVELQTIPVAAGYQHELVYMRDTNTGEAVIARAGPSEQYRSKIDAVFNRVEKTADGSGNITIKAEMGSADKSIDAGNRTSVAGTGTTVKKDIGDVKAQVTS